jgi:hypothetical protein
MYVPHPHFTQGNQYLFYEKEAASILNIPYKEVRINPSGLYQRAAPLEPVSKIVYWNGWKHKKVSNRASYLYHE